MIFLQLTISNLQFTNKLQSSMSEVSKQNAERLQALQIVNRELKINSEGVL